MKTRALVFASLWILLVTSLAYPADINGKWKGSFEGGPQGSIEMNFTFKVDGEKVSGTMSDPMMGETNISEGTLKGDDLSFSVSGSGQMGEMKLAFKGKVSGPDEIKLSFSFGGGQGGDRGGQGGPPGGMELTIKRVK